MLDYSRVGGGGEEVDSGRSRVQGLDLLVDHPLVLGQVGSQVVQLIQRFSQQLVLRLQVLKLRSGLSIV